MTSLCILCRNTKIILSLNPTRVCDGCLSSKQICCRRCKTVTVKVVPKFTLCFICMREWWWMLTKVFCDLCGRISQCTLGDTPICYNCSEYIRQNCCFCCECQVLFRTRQLNGEPPRSVALTARWCWEHTMKSTVPWTRDVFCAASKTLGQKFVVFAIIR